MMHAFTWHMRIPYSLQVMGKNKVLVKVHPEGKYVVDIDKDIDISKLTPGVRVALRNDSYQLHLLLPTKVDPLVSLMKVEKVPDSTYDMIGGCDQQIKEIKEVGRRATLVQDGWLVVDCCSRKAESEVAPAPGRWQPRHDGNSSRGGSSSNGSSKQQEQQQRLMLHVWVVSLASGAEC